MKIIIAFLLLSATIASAQEAGLCGLTFRVGGTSWLGVGYNPIARLAIRPMVAYVVSSSESSNDDDYGTSRSNGDRSGIGVSLAIQYYIGGWSGLIPYVGLGGSYVRTSSTSVTSYRSPDRDTTITRTTIDREKSIGGFFGVQYNVSRWLAVYGEFGGYYSYGHTDYVDDPHYTSKGSAFGLSNSGLGAILYF